MISGISKIIPENIDQIATELKIAGPFNPKTLRLSLKRHSNIMRQNSKNIPTIAAQDTEGIRVHTSSVVSGTSEST